MALSKGDKGWCLSEALKITVAYNGTVLPDHILEVSYKKLCELKEETNKD